jgi:hypothetical protein
LEAALQQAKKEATDARPAKTPRTVKAPAPDQGKASSATEPTEVQRAYVAAVASGPSLSDEHDLLTPKPGEDAWYKRIEERLRAIGIDKIVPAEKQTTIVEAQARNRLQDPSIFLTSGDQATPFRVSQDWTGSFLRQRDIVAALGPAGAHPQVRVTVEVAATVSDAWYRQCRKDNPSWECKRVPAKIPYRRLTKWGVLIRRRPRSGFADI